MSRSVPSPLRSASPPAAVVRAVAGAVRFRGRASRSEFWWWLAVVVVVHAALVAWLRARQHVGSSFAIDGLDEAAALAVLGWAVLTVLPTLAVTVRRLHDAGWSGWWVLLVLVPGVGVVAVLVLALLPPRPADASSAD